MTNIPKRPEVIEYPDFEGIQIELKRKMADKFIQYKNSWKYESLTLEWWLKRLDGEIKEIHEAKDPTILVSEILDAINILCMIYERTTSTCQECNKKVTSFHTRYGEPICSDCYFGITKGVDSQQ